ncbi:MAG: carboxypeptidase regulatory-like domain-containing protein [Phycisphaerales bacterium]|nr:carboxypeptidase regulatory-like domain-containing protein [Phycisphaerales bacterium]MCB9863230.1 carboxypeptidase regulatory-like domain-containing protein [Phycisphaerales bacterium]
MKPQQISVVFMFIVGLITCAASAQQYHSYPEIEAALLAAETDFPTICRRVNLGHTVQGRTMWALCISDNVDIEEDEPEFRYISTMHGDEVVGVELCLMLIDELTSNYMIDGRIKSLVDSVEIWIVPCMNPDGHVANTRENATGVNLNRDFPDPFTSPANSGTGRAPETANIINWCLGRSFTLAANYHCGELVVNYPFDSNAGGNSVFTPTPDEDMFVYISETYTQYNLPMWNSPYFYHGITNGADWYAIFGGMQDWSYRYMGTNEVTIEVSSSDRPSASLLPQFWSENRESMLSYMETCLMGIRGRVTSAADGLPLAATIRIVDRDHDVFTDPDVGDYHRMVEAGSYDLQIDADGYDQRLVTSIPVGWGDATRVDAELWRTLIEAPIGAELFSPTAPIEIRWTGDPTARFQVQASANATDVGTWTDGFESAFLDPEYETGGAADWFVATSSPHTGVRSARAGDINDDESSWLVRWAVGGPMSFWYRVSSESGYDWFRFYIDNELIFQRSGTVAWTQYATTLPAGEHELRWEYNKDVSLSSGSDTVWIDDLSFTEDLVIWDDVVELTDAGATSFDWLPFVAGDDCRVRVRSYRDAEGYGPWALMNASFTICMPGDMDGDFQLNANLDGPAFVAAMLASSSGGAYAHCAGDLNGDGLLDGRDVQGFVLRLLE